jgi:hypothetical protein
MEKEMDSDCYVPTDVGMYSPIETPEDVGNDSGGQWLQEHPASSNQAKGNAR